MGQRSSKKSNSKQKRLDKSNAPLNSTAEDNNNGENITSGSVVDKPTSIESSESLPIEEIWADLPNDIIREIFRRADVIDIITLQTVCRKWREELRSQQLWRSICQRYWPGHPLHNISNYFQFFLKRGGVYFIRSLNHLNRLATSGNKRSMPISTSMMRITNYHELDNGLVLIFEKSQKQFRSKWSRDFWSKTATNFKHGCNLVLAPKFLEDNEHDYILLENSFNDDLIAIFGRTRESADFCEKKIIKIISQMINALKKLHENDIVVGDWCDVSFAVDICGDWFELKMFEYVQMYSVSPSPGTCRYGSFFAPEAINEYRAVLQSDLWTLGAVTYTLLIGIPPFTRDSLVEEYRAVVRGEFTWPEQTAVTDLAKDFVNKLLVKDPLKRLTLQEASEHPWITNPNPSTTSLEGPWLSYFGSDSNPNPEDLATQLGSTNL